MYWELVKSEVIEGIVGGLKGYFCLRKIGTNDLFRCRCHTINSGEAFFKEIPVLVSEFRKDYPNHLIVVSF